MHARRRIVALIVAALSLAACSSAAAPAWTYAPTQPPTPGASAAAGSAAPGTSAPSAAAPGTSAPSSAAASAGAAPTEVPGAAGGVTLTASGVAYDKQTLEVTAGTPFTLTFINNDAGIPHNVSIHKDSPTGAEVWKGEIFSGVATKAYQVPALDAGTYGFACSVHPNMTGTLTVK